MANRSMLSGPGTADLRLHFPEAIDFKEDTNDHKIKYIDDTDALRILLAEGLPATGFIIELAQDNITAHAGGGQASAFQITGQTARVTVVATAGDSVKLPVSVAGLEVLVINHGANTMQVFGAGTDTVNDIATATGFAQMPGSFVIYSCPSAGLWYAAEVATGYSGSFATASFTGGLTAHAGGGQGSALPITTMVSRFTVVATIGDSAVLPATVANVSIGPITIANAAANSMNVFPAGTDQINALGASTAFALAGGKNATFYSTGLGQWHAVLSA